MFENERVKLAQSFLIPTVIVMIGGIFVHLPDWEWVGWSIVGIAGVCVGWLVYAGIKQEQLQVIQAQLDYDLELQKIETAKKVTKVVVDTTALEGNSFSQAYGSLQINPIKLKKFAEGVLGGKKLTIREWTPVKLGKLFSDGEWRRLIVFMKQPIQARTDVKFIFQVNPSDEHQGFYLTHSGRKWLEDVRDAQLLTSV
jgi:hypothetical protein